MIDLVFYKQRSELEGNVNNLKLESICHVSIRLLSNQEISWKRFIKNNEYLHSFTFILDTRRDSGIVKLWTKWTNNWRKTGGLSDSEQLTTTIQDKQTMTVTKSYVKVLLFSCNEWFEKIEDNQQRQPTRTSRLWLNRVLTRTNSVMTAFTKNWIRAYKEKP